MRVVVCLALIVVGLPALAGGKPLFRYTDANGQVHYTDQPPFKGAKPMVLYNRSAPTVSRKWADAEAVETVRSATRFAVSLDTPSPGQVYRDASAGVAVAANVMPGLAKGFGLSFRVDDVAQSAKPIPEIRTMLHGLSAGQHVISTVLISPEGVELARSQPVTIVVKANLARN